MPRQRQGDPDDLLENDDWGDSTVPVFTPRELQSVIEAPLTDNPTQRRLDQARVRKALMLLAKGNVHRAQAWLDRVAMDDPGKAIDLWLKMLKFTVPELKAVAVDMHVTDDSPPTKLSIAELEEFLRSRRFIEGEAVMVEDDS